MGFALSPLRLSSPAFADGGTIPARHAGAGDNVSPELAWSDVPDGAASLALICHDPDAPLVTPDGAYGFVHWVLYNIPASVTGVPEGAQGYTTGPNQTGEPGYTGPYPPPGHGVHRYYFWLLALSCDPDLGEGLDLGSLLRRVEPDVIGMNRLVGTFETPA